MRERAQRLARYCSERVGESLRFVSIYNVPPDSADGPGMIYVREDLQSEYTPDELSGLLDHAAGVHERVLGAESHTDVLGEADAAVYVFENAVIMQLVCEPDAGIVVSFDPGATQYLSDFVTDCLEQAGIES